MAAKIQKIAAHCPPTAAGAGSAEALVAAPSQIQEVQKPRGSIVSGAGSAEVLVALRLKLRFLPVRASGIRRHQARL